jgi:hypothetical protein
MTPQEHETGGADPKKDGSRTPPALSLCRDQVPVGGALVKIRDRVVELRRVRAGARRRA